MFQGDLKTKAKEATNHSTHNGTDGTFLNGKIYIEYENIISKHIWLLNSD